jgi:hypothetical protein
VSAALSGLQVLRFIFESDMPELISSFLSAPKIRSNLKTARGQND